MIVVICIIFVLFLAAAFLAVLNISPYIILKPGQRTVQWYARRTAILSPVDAGLQYENVVITTDDNLKLSAWFLPSSSPRGTIIYLHGIADSKISGIGIAHLLVRYGYHVLLLDIRKHGESEGEFCTYGYYEKYDVNRAVDYLFSRKEIAIGKIGLMGTSMGAAIAIQAAAIDERVCCVVAEASFTDLRTITLDYQRHIIGMRLKWLNNLVLRKAEKIANFRVDDVSPLNAIAQLQIPVLLVHGKRDPFIKYQYAEELYHRANSQSEVHFLDDAAHDDIRSVGGEAYENKLLDFLDRNMSG